MKYAILVDTTRCSYCGKCVDACRERHHNVNPGTFYTDVALTYPRGTSERALAVPTLCMHCVNAPCAKVCQGNAIKQTPEGAVIWNQDRCIACLSCVSVCAFKNSLHYDGAKNKVFKCDMCYDRIVQGQKPACVETCESLGYDARLFGPFDEMLQKGLSKAEEVGGTLLYPESTHVLVLVQDTNFVQPMMADRFGLSPTYPVGPRIKANVTQYARVGWAPVLAGLALFVARWRSNKTENLIRVRPEEQDDKKEGQED
jgi:Fe-S-cluster-containing dehydrogenase component